MIKMQADIEAEIKQLRTEVKQLKEMVMSLMNRILPTCDDELQEELQEGLPPGTIQLPTNVGFMN